MSTRRFAIRICSALLASMPLLLTACATGQSAITATSAGLAGSPLPGTSIPPTPTFPPKVPPPPLPWIAAPDQLSAKNADGIFAIKSIFKVRTSILFAYAMRAAQPGPPTVSAAATASLCPDAPPAGAPATATVHDFGTVHGDAVGLIAVPWRDAPGQIITLDVTPPGLLHTAWHLEPLRQIGPAHSGDFTGGWGDAATIPEILVVTGGTPKQPGTVTGYIAEQDGAIATRYIARLFFLVDLQGNVKQVVEAEFVATGAGTGGANGTVAPINLSPTYPPTATAVGATAVPPTPPRIRCT